MKVLKSIFFSQFNGGRWCFVENNIGSGFSTCPDLKPSEKFLGESWSYLACISPAQSTLQCQNCNGIRGKNVGKWSVTGSVRLGPTVG